MTKPLPSPLDVVDAVTRAKPWRPDMLLPFQATEDDCAAALRCIQDDPIGLGALRAFEEKLAARTGMAHAVAVASGTAALELALRVVGVAPGDQVIVPAMTFAGAAAAVTHCGATPRFVDCLFKPIGAVGWYKLERHLYRLSAEERRKIKAVIAVDLLGQPSATPELRLLCEQHGMALVEDAAQALGSVEVGRHARVAVLSFNNNKIVTSTGGGAVLTNDAEAAERVRHLATTAKKPSAHHYDYDAVGHNYRMPNLLAAVALGQMDRLDSTVGKKFALYLRYWAEFSRLDGYELVEHPSSSNAWLNCVMVNSSPTAAIQRDAILRAMTSAKLGCRAMFTPLHMVEPYKDCPRQNDLSIAEDIFNRAVCLPSGVDPWA